MSLISILPMVYNYVAGIALSNVSDTLAVYLARLSIGNHKGVAPESATAAIVAQSLQHKLINVIPDLVNACLLFIFYLYWHRKSARLVAEIKEEIKLPSYSTV